MQLGNLLSKKPKNNRFYTIAIDGRGGSGKTAFAEYVKSLLPNFVVINGDDYFEPVVNQVVWGEFNEERFRHDVIEPLKIGNTFIYSPFDWATMQITSKKVVVQHGIIIERCYSFEFDFDWDVKIWIETSREVCLERGRACEHMSKERVLSAWKDVWQPQEDAYIQEKHPMGNANIVMNGDKSFKEQLIF